MPRLLRRVLCDGDSLTVGLGASSDETTYPAVLRKRLPGVDVRAFGVGGERIDQIGLRAAVVDALYDEDVADALVMMGGANDIAQGADADTIRARWIEYFTDRRRATPRRLLVATTITPIDLAVDSGNPKTFNTTADRFNAWLRANYTRCVDRLADVAADPAFSDPADRTFYQPDGVHFTDAANAALAEIVRRSIETD